MASFLCGQEVFQISVSSTYGVVEFKADLLALYSKTGGKGQPVTFLLTDNQIVNERFLVYINDLLSTGYIADLCTPVKCLQILQTCKMCACMSSKDSFSPLPRDALEGR